MIRSLALPRSREHLGVFGAAMVGARLEQQDAFRLRWLEGEGAWLMVLADGMGGHTGGAIASKLASEGFVSAFQALRQRKANLEQSFRGALNAANKMIANAQQARPEAADMGTTLVAAHLSSEGLCWISVGDSPLWLFRTSKLHRLNEDHSLRAITGGGAGNMLQSVLNGQPVAMIDCRADPVELGADDVCLLASDGVLTLSEAQIRHALDLHRGQGPEAISNILLRGVAEQRKPNQDNCTLIVAAPVASRSGLSARLGSIATRLHKKTVIAFAGAALIGFGATMTAYYLLT